MRTCNATDKFVASIIGTGNLCWFVASLIAPGDSFASSMMLSPAGKASLVVALSSIAPASSVKDKEGQRQR